MKLKIYSVSDRYIEFLRKDNKLKNVFDNKEGHRTHSRKYLGVVLNKNGYNYFIPFSSPKDTDYTTDEDGNKVIRKSIIPIIRMISDDSVSGLTELKGTLKLSNMIPIPDSELTYYDINIEKDASYKKLVEKEYAFIKSNMDMICKNANIIYNQKTKAHIFYKDKKAPRYISETIDFIYAEKKCEEFKNLDNWYL